MKYLDSSALLKLLFDEPESSTLQHWLGEHNAGSLISSDLARIEVVRSARRLDPTVVPTARRLLAQVDIVPITSHIVEHAAEVGGVMLRSLDAIHLASALSLGGALSVVIAYDVRLADAARTSGLRVVAPGIV